MRVAEVNKSALFYTFSKHIKKTLKSLHMKKLNVYGVELTELENMIFSKWVSNEGIAMNTKTEIERKEITLNWLNEYEKRNKI